MYIDVLQLGSIFPMRIYASAVQLGYVIGNQEVKLTYHLRCRPVYGRVLANMRKYIVIFIETYIFIGILLTLLLHEEVSCQFFLSLYAF